MRLWLADDAVLIREGLAGLLIDAGHEVTRSFADATELVAAGTDPESELPDVLISDVRMPPRMADDGLSAVLEVRAQAPDLAVMVLSQYLAPAYAQRLFAQGANAGTGYLLKERVGRIADFLSALEVVAAGGVFIDPEVAARMMGRDLGIQSLTQREREVLALMAKGRSNDEIASELVITPAAVAKHVSSIFLRLGLPATQPNRRVRAILTYLSATGGLYYQP